jgi:hypothetical protein
MRRNTDLKRPWKIHVNAELAGKLNYVTIDPLTSKPKYSARTLIVNRLLAHWFDSLEGKPVNERTPMPTLEEIRSL